MILLRTTSKIFHVRDDEGILPRYVVLFVSGSCRCVRHWWLCWSLRHLDDLVFKISWCIQPLSKRFNVVNKYDIAQFVHMNFIMRRRNEDWKIERYLNLTKKPHITSTISCYKTVASSYNYGELLQLLNLLPCSDGCCV